MHPAQRRSIRVSRGLCAQPKPPLVCLGALNIDLITHSENVDASKKIVGAHKFVMKPGGGGLNQSVAAALLMRAMRADTLTNVFLIGKVGHDSHGEQLINEVQQQGISKELIKSTKEYPTGVANILVTQATAASTPKKVQYQIAGANEHITEGDVYSQFRRLGNNLRGGVCSLMFEINLQANLAGLECAKRLDMRTVLRAKPLPEKKEIRQLCDLSFFGLVDVLIASEEEITLLHEMMGGASKMAHTAADAVPDPDVTAEYHKCFPYGWSQQPDDEMGIDDVSMHAFDLQLKAHFKAQLLLRSNDGAALSNLIWDLDSTPELMPSVATELLTEGVVASSRQEAGTAELHEDLTAEQVKSLFVGNQTRLVFHRSHLDDFLCVCTDDQRRRITEQGVSTLSAVISASEPAQEGDGPCPSTTTKQVLRFRKAAREPDKWDEDDMCEWLCRVQKMPIDLASAEAKRFMKAIDTDRSGTISESEFLTGCQEIRRARGGELLELMQHGSALLEEGVEHVVVSFSKKDVYCGSGGCMLISRSRLSRPKLPRCWEKLHGQCRLLPSGDGPDRVLLLELPPPHQEGYREAKKRGEADPTGAVDGFVGTLSLLLSLNHKTVDALVLATILGSMSLRFQGAASSYVDCYHDSASARNRTLPSEQNMGFDMDSLLQELGVSLGSA